MEKIPFFPNVHHLNFDREKFNLFVSRKKEKKEKNLLQANLFNTNPQWKRLFRNRNKEKRKNLYQLNLFNANPQWKRLLRDGLKRKNMNLTSSLLIRNGYDIIFQNFNREKLWG